MQENELFDNKLNAFLQTQTGKKMSNINKTTHENYPIKIHPIYNLKNFIKIVDKHITPEDLKKPIHPVYNTSSIQPKKLFKNC